MNPSVYVTRITSNCYSLGALDACTMGLGRMWWMHYRRTQNLYCLFIRRTSENHYIMPASSCWQHEPTGLSCKDDGASTSIRKADLTRLKQCIGEQQIRLYQFIFSVCIK
ncbi:uncharacterized protein LOC113271666 [Papaver somniferum]|uniref:uncharacterized protein LOC113271666 n=1 Tax=Papaver somniferum TaxID=3469 RepID=UPI000E6FAD6F|nr:uncharacterized protein LOC113271666 [Papaver somniferum]